MITIKTTVLMEGTTEIITLKIDQKGNGAQTIVEMIKKFLIIENVQKNSKDVMTEGVIDQDHLLAEVTAHANTIEIVILLNVDRVKDLVSVIREEKKKVDLVQDIEATNVIKIGHRADEIQVQEIKDNFLGQL